MSVVGGLSLGDRRKKGDMAVERAHRLEAEAGVVENRHQTQYAAVECLV